MRKKVKLPHPFPFLIIGGQYVLALIALAGGAGGGALEKARLYALREFLLSGQRRPQRDH
jgi:hypothetical protein